MMVLRHIGAPSATVVRHGHDNREDEDHNEAPIDLSTKIVRSGVVSGSPSIRQSEVSWAQARSQFHSITSPISSHSSRSPISRFPRDETTRLLYRSGVIGSEARWREAQIVHGNDDDNSYSSPDSGLQRDSPGEDEDVGNKSASPPLNSLRQNLIPLSLIRARYNNHNNHNNNQRADCSSGASAGTEDSGRSEVPPDHVQTKRARLEEMVSHIKQSKPSKERPRRHSGDDDTSSGDHVISSDEVADDGPTDLRSLGLRLGESSVDVTNSLNLCRDGFPMRSDEDEPCNLACSKNRSNNNNNCSETSPFDMWKMKGSPKTMPPLSPSEAAKMYSVDPETYQQQIMQLQLTSAAMLGEPGGLLKAMGNYPPWVYLGYYSQLLHSYQAQEILRQYAMQSQSSTPPISQGEKSPSVPHTLGSSGYNCGSPMSPASLSEGPNGMDSDGSVVGQGTSGSANGKRAPRAMTGRHVRTGTGASPATLKTLREKIEERQRLKAQQMHQGVLVVQNHSNKGKPSKIYKKSKK